ncbi:MAG: hypothetical protein SH818_16905 [Saprospiraceae bacterium]|nr:hypothetical protein [Saprospiraceae bacterium]
MNNYFKYLSGHLHPMGFATNLAWRTLLTIVLSGIGCSLSGQNEQKKDSTEKLTPRMKFTAIQRNGDSILLQVAIQVRREGVLQLVDYEPVAFFYLKDSIALSLGATLTNDKGVASLWIAETTLLKEDHNPSLFKVTFNGTEDIYGDEAEASFKKAEIKISAEEIDSIYTIKLKLFASGDEILPLAATDVVFYVKRYFANLKLGEGTTDESGEISFECPRDIPGDRFGNIILIAQAEDLEEFGTVSSTITQPWGVPLNLTDDKISRALWSHAPPIWMLTVFIVLMSVVWGHYFVIIYKFIKLRKQ